MAYRYTHVRLVDFGDPTCRQFIAPFLLARATHKSGPVQARARFGQQVEKALRGWLEARTALLSRRLLGYTEVGGGSARPGYRELDAVKLAGEREEEPWCKDWQACQEEGETTEPLGTLGAALLAALGRADDGDETRRGES